MLGDAMRAHDLAGTVTFLGMRDDVPDLLAAADVFAFPSRWEGAGGTLIEAMAVETPIVTSDLPTLGQTVDDATAVLVRPGDASDLASGVLRVLGDPAAAAVRARAGRARFEAEFTIGAGARRMAELYGAVASVRPAPHTDPSTPQADL